MKDFESYFKSKRQRIEVEINRLLTKQPMPKRLKAAVNYSLKDGGKRLRSVLVLMVDDMFRGKFSHNGHSEDVLNLSLSLECIHTYSLIHDDLPCMDDDNLRRGKPTSHIQFDEATAVLTGDALLTLAFELVSRVKTKSDMVAKLITLLAKSAGGNGMVGGQMLDMQNKKKISLRQMKKIHQLKTGALIESSILLPAILKKANSTEYLCLKTYSECIGIAFQIVDDILDVTQTSEVLGKPANSDIDNNKNTYVSLMGLEWARKEAFNIIDKSKASLKNIKRNTTYLSALGDYVLNRTE